MGELEKRIEEIWDKYMPKEFGNPSDFWGAIEKLFNEMRVDFPHVFSTYIGVDGSLLEITEKDCNGRLSAKWFTRWLVKGE